LASAGIKISEDFRAWYKLMELVRPVQEIASAALGSSINLLPARFIKRPFFASPSGGLSLRKSFFNRDLRDAMNMALLLDKIGH
jgi:hypothetical protein